VLDGLVENDHCARSRLEIVFVCDELAVSLPWRHPGPRVCGVVSELLRPAISLVHAKGPAAPCSVLIIGPDTIESGCRYCDRCSCFSSGIYQALVEPTMW
jgi:hypothetical protein